MKIPSSITSAAPAAPLFTPPAKREVGGDVASSQVGAPAPLVPGSSKLELTSPVEAFAGVGFRRAANDEAASVKVRKPLANPQAFAREAVERVIQTWQKPGYLQPGQAPVGAVGEAAMAEAIAVVVSELSKLVADFKGYSPVQTVDAETQAALVEGGLCSREEAATFLNANSNADFTPVGSAASRIRSALIDLLGYEPNDKQRGKAKHGLIGFLVRQLFEIRGDNNIGAVVLDGFERPLVLFRGSTMVGVEEQNSAFRNLIEKGNVTNVVNIYAGSFPLHDLIAKEVEVCREYGVVHHDERKQVPLRQWRKLIDDEALFLENKAKAEESVAEVIKDIVMPGGEAPEGNIFLHCGGGMHRTGMIVGIIRRYFNNDSMEAIKADYQRHVAWKSDEDPGGYEELNLRFIEEFDLSVLDRVIKGESGANFTEAAA